jgi:hypothetical protein
MPRLRSDLAGGSARRPRNGLLPHMSDLNALRRKNARVINFYVMFAADKG